MKGEIFEEGGQIIESEILNLKIVNCKTEKAIKLGMQVTEQENGLNKDSLLNILKKKAG